ncbi:tyrosine-type recombinase/integrase [Streptomyces sp. NPDC088674]|uniref:tyrosine-type recombinase/integrase n=1 Tax=Streptomyces sp. NPDC088674 TaxID=3365869 RepID=UPI003803975E
MPGYIEDRWFTKRPDPKTGERRKTARHGQGKRYRVAGVPGVKDRSFDRLTGPEGANAWLAKAQHESTRGEFIDPRDGNLLLREYVEQEWWPNRKYDDPATERTVKGRIWTHILPLLGATPLNGIKTPQLRTWLTALKAQTGPSTATEAWGYLSAILQAAVDDERITKNYCRSQTTLRPPGRTAPKARAWDRGRVMAVRGEMDSRFRVTVDLGVGAGLRQSEVFGLADEDIDDELMLLHVRRQVKKVGEHMLFALPKGGKERTVPITKHLLQRIREHSKVCPPRAVTLPWGHFAEPENERELKERAPRTFNLLVTGARGGAVRRDSYNTRVWKPALSAVGLIPESKQKTRALAGGRVRIEKRYAEARELGFHSLRHTFASVQLDARESPVSVSKWMGHANPSITLRIYAHFMPEADGRGRAAMEAWFADS